MTDDLETFLARELPNLVRFGLVLTGDPEQARAVVRATVTRMRWWTVRRASDPAASVRRAMAREYSLWPAARAGTSSSSTEEAALAVLTPRQRAVTVLRYEQDLTDQAMADALGIGIGTAKADAATALSRMRSRYPETDRPDATALGRRVRRFLTATQPDVPLGDLVVSDLVTANRRASGRRTAATVAAGAATAGVVTLASILVVGAVRDRTPEAAPTPVESSPPTYGLGVVDVDSLAEITPDEFVGGLVIGMTVAEVEAVLGEEAVFRDNVPGVTCALQVELGSEVRGWFEPWPLPTEGATADADAELILTEVAYYGKEFKTLAGMAVGMQVPDAVELGNSRAVQTPLGEGVHTVYMGIHEWNVVHGIGYRVWPAGCSPASLQMGSAVPLSQARE